MPPDLPREFSRLARRTTAGDPRAPWWVNWLLQGAIFLAVLWGLAWSGEWLWLNATGQALGLNCWLLGLLPIHLLMPIGFVVGLVGLLLALGSQQRAAGLVWLILGTLIYSTPELLLSLGTATGCSPSATQ
jgi:hypothetical protein